jgi:hypothetical protein
MTLLRDKSGDTALRIRCSQMQVRPRSALIRNAMIGVYSDSNKDS